MKVTPDQVRAEHEAAVASFTPEQELALDRLARARDLGDRTVATLNMRLEAVFVDEAAERSAHA